MTLRARICTLVLAAALIGLAACDNASSGPTGASIRGGSMMTAQQIGNWFRSNHKTANLPWGLTVDGLAQLFIEEGSAANVRGDVAFAQTIIETGWLSFPSYGQVHPGDYNYAGLGACNSCHGGHTFPDARTGVRAQMELLRGYADRNFHSSLLSPPMSYRGIAPNWTDLNGRWAVPGTTYGQGILSMFQNMLMGAGLPGNCPADGLSFPSGFNCPANLAQPGRAVASNPLGGYYVLNGDGTVTARGGAPYYGSPHFGWDIARDIAVMPGGHGYAVLDGYGAFHLFGTATALSQLGGVYWNGWDIARSVAISSSGNGYAVLDGWGGVHAFGDAPRLTPQYWKGWDIARSLQFTPDNRGVFVLDGFGAIHMAGTARLPAGGPYWNGWDIARDFVVYTSSTRDNWGFAVLDGFGGIHAVNIWWRSLPRRFSSLSSDRWRGITFAGGNYVGVRNDGTTAVG
jgi:hypothetical protein